MVIPEIRTLETSLMMENKAHNIRKMTVGKKRFWSWPGQGKVLMLVGATGAGKSTLINGMVNHIMGVRYEDDYRYKLVDDGETRSQAHSQTRLITAYKFNKDDKMQLPYKLTVIDTPGYGDTQGLERDKEITRQIKEFFSLKGNDSIDQLNGIGFVVQASLPRLTHTQRYIFDSILSIFGKDISESIFMMVTFADGKKPPVLAAIKEAKVEFQKSFKFNNSALYPEEDDDDDDSFNEMYWKMGQTSFENFFKSFAKAKSVSLKLTREVLNEREELECVAEGLGPQIRVGLHKVDQLRQEETILKLHEKDILTNKDFEYEVDVIKQRKIDLPAGEYVTNCITCHMTCHYPCRIPLDKDKHHCAAIHPCDTCNVCPGNCHWTKHFNNGYRFELYTVKEKRTSEELKKRYQEAKSKKMEKEQMMEGLAKELDTMYNAVFIMISRARDILARLEEIALKPNPLSEVDHIDLLIQSEQCEAKEGWTRRVEAYKEVRKQAMVLSKIKDRNALKEQNKGPVEKLWQSFQETFL
ncbi:uncharacterized protein LOC116292500 [Actinia tenebrosa]|uniref:Uncharacterized protein LOC116292500 n=1 Tax=Actinia tenebrosa TaxID=6105 RepID=A0A6P8HL91_ACTTE|nr:uncharacterized protein LOC116292500 [Actinia tenebrosa]